MGNARVGKLMNIRVENHYKINIFKTDIKNQNYKQFPVEEERAMVTSTPSRIGRSTIPAI